MSNSPTNKRQKVNNADILSPNIHDYARAAKNDKIVTAVNRFNQFLKEITDVQYCDWLGFDIERVHS